MMAGLYCTLFLNSQRLYAPAVNTLHDLDTAIPRVNEGQKPGNGNIFFKLGYFRILIFQLSSYFAKIKTEENWHICICDD